MRLGCDYHSGKASFRVWAPFVEDLTLKIVEPREESVKMSKDRDGYWTAEFESVDAGSLYFYHSPAFGDKPDPASSWQPRGVHGPSGIVDHDEFSWNDRKWPGIPMARMIAYEIHVGTFTPEGTFDAAIEKLDYLKELGVTAVEIMPVAQFPGGRNWGYDGVYPFAVQDSYGGPSGLKRLIDACHQKGLAVILDVVYNHLGPEGNYLSQFGPYFTGKYHTPWGEALNFDDAYSDHVRRFFYENALSWFREFHVEALRLDAVHAIFDNSAKPFLMELKQKVDDYARAAGKRCFLIAESALNDARVVESSGHGGFAIDGQWSDDLHHALHTVLTGESEGYYMDYGDAGCLTKAFQQGFVYDWQYSSYRKRHYGSSPVNITPDQLVVCIQNHDQIGNRMMGERLSSLVSAEALKLAAGCILLSPYLPLLFMGEEYAEKAPFQYFVSHSDQALIRAVRQGRAREFEAFRWKGELPDPQAEETFTRSRLQWDLAEQAGHKEIFRFYRDCIAARKEYLFPEDLSAFDRRADSPGEGVVRFSFGRGKHFLLLMNFNSSNAAVSEDFDGKNWQKIVDSAEEKYGGPGALLPTSISKGNHEMPPLTVSFFTRNG